MKKIRTLTCHECGQTVQCEMTERILDCTEHTKEFHAIKFWQLHSLLVCTTNLWCQSGSREFYIILERTIKLSYELHVYFEIDYENQKKI